MKRVIAWLIGVSTVLLGATAASYACGEEQHAAAKSVTVAEAAALFKDGRAYAFDANSKTTRDKHGAVPGAVLLSSSAEYDLRELPPNKDAKLVFYCANTQCKASHGAAQRALAAGYEDVSVMPDGIKGWIDAGHPTTKGKVAANTKTPRS